jgi:hypothetical protein
MRIPSNHVAPVRQPVALPIGASLEWKPLRAVASSALPTSEERETLYRLLPGVTSLEHWLDLNA